MIDELTNLARERSGEKRRELLGRVSEIFFDGAERFSDQEAFLFGDVLSSLLDDVDFECKVALSNRLATEDRAPRNLAKALAGDENHEIASPILQHSNTLQDEDIVQIAMQRPQNHLLAISRRSKLAESVTDILIERGETQVLQSLVMNRGAGFSENGYACLADKAMEDENLKDALSHRDDMPADIAQRVMPLLSDESRARLIDLMANDPEKGAKLVHLARDASERQRLLAKKRRLEAKVMVEDVKAGRAELDDVVCRLADANRIPDLALILGAIGEIPTHVLTNVIVKSDAEPIAMLCRSLDVGQDAFRALAEMRSRRMKTPASATRDLIAEYGTIFKPNADRALRFVKMRTMGDREAVA